MNGIFSREEIADVLINSTLHFCHQGLHDYRKFSFSTNTHKHKTVDFLSANTIFHQEVYPVTSTKEAETTVEVTVGSGQTVSQYTTYVVTQNGTVYTTKSLSPTTVPVPTTLTTTGTPSTVTSSPPSQVTAGANSQNRPAVALVAGIFGLMALF